MDRCVVHSSTFGQNELAMVCGLATLAILEEEGLVEKARLRGEEIMEGLKKLDGKHEWIKEIRGKGLMIGIEFGKPDSLKKKIQWNMVHQINAGLFGELIVMPLLAKHRILTQVSGHEQDVVKIIPPLVIEPQHGEKFVSALDAVLEECGRLTGPIWEMGKNLVKQAMADKKAASG